MIHVQRLGIFGVNLSNALSGTQLYCEKTHYHRAETVFTSRSRVFAHFQFYTRDGILDASQKSQVFVNGLWFYTRVFIMANMMSLSQL